ncbi:MAG TPA: NADH-quinone oxidoreductase subunit L [Candidatus Omnitrophica bacterium]|nr:NADH-quinone oxidoreductase subunit L [Candidatus Omnitrophota bacterium]
MLNLCWIILGLPLAAAALISLLVIPFEKASKEKDFFRTLSAWISVLSISAAFILSVILFRQFQAAQGHYGTALEASLPWMNLAGIKMELGILLNPIALIMLLIVNGVAALVTIFSARYMQGEEGYSRYFAALSFFVFAMLGIVLANNLIQIFIFWELVGVASYLLIGFWFQKPSASLASKKAFLTTRVGDAGMMLGILLLFGILVQTGTGTFNFLELETKLHQNALPSGLLTWACIGLFLGAVGKSAQVPLHVWLPDAMEGPTPASALIHAATMVAAGVYMLARLFFLFEMSPVALQVIAWTGVATALIAATIAVVQNDIKKVLAYSTLSQLGYMVMAIGLHHPEAGMFHLVTHAFFKALLFLGAGSLIHALHTQDIWQMSATLNSQKNAGFKKLPITVITFLIGTAALAGIPFTSGFFSKEEILNAASHGPLAIFIASLVVVMLTAYYMGRVLTVVFFSSASKAHGKHPHDIHEDNALVTLPLIILAIFSIAAGYLPFQALLSDDSHAAHPPLWLAILSVSLAVFGLLASFVLYRNKTEDRHAAIFQVPVKIIQEKFYFDHFYDWFVSRIQGGLAIAADFFERKILVAFGTEGTAKLVTAVGSVVRKMQNGWIQTYGLFFVIGWIILISYLIGSGGNS